jgi:hypothetical protein
MSSATTVVNRAERFERVDMDVHSTALEAMIPAAYTPGSLQYFTLIESPARAHLFPAWVPT